MTAQVTYTGDLRTRAVHLLSCSEIETDAPTDNHGKGARFSPTDLVATALASCILTTIGIAGATHDINIDGAICDVKKIMTANPRKIGEIVITLRMADGSTYSDKQKKLIQHIAKTCPVFESLHPDCIKTMEFEW